MVRALVLDDLPRHELRRPNLAMENHIVFYMPLARLQVPSHIILEDLVPRSVARALDLRILQVFRSAEVDQLHHLIKKLVTQDPPRARLLKRSISFEQAEKGRL